MSFCVSSFFWRDNSSSAFATNGDRLSEKKSGMSHLEKSGSKKCYKCKMSCKCKLPFKCQVLLILLRRILRVCVFKIVKGQP